MIPIKPWLLLALMQFIFLKQMIHFIQPQEDTEREQCQTLIQTTILNTTLMKLHSEPVILTQIDIQVRFSDQDNPKWNSQVKELLTVLKWLLTKIIYLDLSRHLSIIVLATSWIQLYGTPQAGLQKRTCTQINREHSTESNLTNLNHSTTELSRKVLEECRNSNLHTSQWTWNKPVSVVKVSSQQVRRTSTIEDSRITVEISILIQKLKCEGRVDSMHNNTSLETR